MSGSLKVKTFWGSHVATVTVSIFLLIILFFGLLVQGPDVIIFILLTVHSEDMNLSYSHISSFKKIFEC